MSSQLHTVDRTELAIRGFLEEREFLLERAQFSLDVETALRREKLQTIDLPLDLGNVALEFRFLVAQAELTF
jgi:hypothetical protein